MSIPTQAEFVRQIDAFLARHEMKESRLSREATGEPGLIAAIRSGKRSPTLNTVEKLTGVMKRVEAEAATQAKLHAPPPGEVAEEDIPLPFSSAPVSPTGGSSPICSSTTAPATSSTASGSCPACSAPVAAGRPALPSPSCSAEEEFLMAGPSEPTEAGK